MVATDVRQLANKQIILNREAIAVNQDPRVIPGDLVYSHNSAQTWTKPMANNQWAVVLYNSEVFAPFSHAKATLRFAPAHLPGWPGNATSAHVRDLWQHKDLGVFKTSVLFFFFFFFFFFLLRFMAI